jgi:hypothetical protein
VGLRLLTARPVLVGLQLHQASQEHQLRVLAAAAAVRVFSLVFLLAAVVALATVEKI